MDRIKEHTKQPRSSPPKPRTDFSSFSFSSPGSNGEGSSRSEACSSSESEEESEDRVEFSLAPFSMSSDQRSRRLSDFYQLSVTGVGISSQNATLGSCNRTSSNSLMTGETCSAANLRSQDAERNILSHFYGSQSNGWLHQKEDILLPEDCLEVRSCTHKQDSPYALKNASVKTLSISNGTESNFLKKEKGERKQKPKNHFPEANMLLKSAKITRRLRVMRHLGLIAPTGSPF